MFRNEIKAMKALKELDIKGYVPRASFVAKAEEILGQTDAWNVKISYGPKTHTRIIMLNIPEHKLILTWSKGLARPINLAAIRPHKRNGLICWESMLKYNKSTWTAELEMLASGKFGAKEIRGIADLIFNATNATQVDNQLFGEIMNKHYAGALL